MPHITFISTFVSKKSIRSMQAASQPKVSIIVPVYNAGMYLPDLLNCLVKQTLQNIEIILVLDCPTDGSDKVAEQYAAKDNRIILVNNKTNLHVGLSRNEGLKIARGEYVGFCDHDDILTEDMFEKMYLQGAAHKADVVVADYNVTNGEKTWHRKFPANINSQEFIKQSLFALVGYRMHLNNRTSYHVNGMVWNQIYKLEFIKKHHILFPDNRKITFEDRVFLLQVYAHAEKIVHIPESLYTHVWHTTNTGASYSFKSLPLIIAYLTELHRFITQEHIIDQTIARYTDATLLLLYTSFRHELRHRSLWFSIKQLNLIRKNTLLQKYLKYAFRQLKNYPPTKIIFLLMIYNPFCRKYN